jgi:ribosomal protein S18 acetylase RimI-like enzyme
VIAAIGFERGHGTRLLRKFIELAERYEVAYIGIEQTGPDESIQNFVRKFGFSEYRNERNWLVRVDDLSELLTASP